MAALTVIIALLSFYIPFLSVLVYFLIALPTVILYRRYGFVAAFLESLTASLLLLLFMDIFNCLIYAVNIMLPGLMIGSVYRSQKDGVVRFCTGYVAFLGSLAAEMAIFQFVTGISITQDFLNELDTSFATMKNLYTQTGLLQESGMQSFNQNLDEMKDLYTTFFPAIVLILPAALSYIDLLICDGLMKRLRLSYVPMKPITQWQLPPYSQYVLALTYIVSVALSHLIADPSVKIYAETVTLLTLTVFWVLGLSFYYWLIQEKTGKPRRFLRFLILFFSLFVPIGAPILILTGIFEMFFNLRRFFTKDENEGKR